MEGSGYYYFGRLSTARVPEPPFSFQVVQTRYPTGFPATVKGPDGALWFSVGGWPVKGRLTTSGFFSEYDELPLSGPGVNGLSALTVGPGGLWFLSSGGTVGLIPVTPDNTKPSSRAVLPVTVASSNIEVNLSGNDVGWGILDYSVYVSDNGAPFTRWLSNTTINRVYFAGLLGHRYSFFSVARDAAGNVEDLKSSPDSTIQLPSQLIQDINSDGQINCIDVSMVRAAIGKRSGQPGFDTRADVNADGIIDVRDLMMINQRLIPGTQCR